MVKKAPYARVTISYEHVPVPYSKYVSWLLTFTSRPPRRRPGVLVQVQGLPDTDAGVRAVDHRT